MYVSSSWNPSVKRITNVKDFSNSNDSRYGTQFDLLSVNVTITANNCNNNNNNNRGNLTDVLHTRFSSRLENIEEEKCRAVEEAVSKARKEWIIENSKVDNQSDIEDQIAAARREWIKNHNDELERRLSNAIQEVRRIWDEEQKLKTKKVRNKCVVLTHGRCPTAIGLPWWRCGSLPRS